MIIKCERLESIRNFIYECKKRVEKKTKHRKKNEIVRKIGNALRQTLHTNQTSRYILSVAKKNVPSINSHKFNNEKHSGFVENCYVNFYALVSKALGILLVFGSFFPQSSHRSCNFVIIITHISSCVYAVRK